MSGNRSVDDKDCWLSWEEEDGELVAMLNFSEEMLARLEWEVDDFLIWEQCEDRPEAFILRKISG